jgi:hypothetical protein
MRFIASATGSEPSATDANNERSLSRSNVILASAVED